MQLGNIEKGAIILAVLVLVFLLIPVIRKGNKGIDIEKNLYLYQSFQPHVGYMYHLKPDCADKSIYIRQSEVIEMDKPVFCSNCINPVQMVQLELLISEKKEEKKAVENINRLYNTLKTEGASVGDLNEFSKSLRDKEQREWIYSFLLKKGYTDLGSKSDFSKKLSELYFHGYFMNNDL